MDILFSERYFLKCYRDGGNTRPKQPTGLARKLDSVERWGRHKSVQLMISGEPGALDLEMLHKTNLENAQVARPS